MDGSCNGMQHYAALGRDKDAAYQVNLIKGEKPGDVYSHIAKMVSAIVDKDSENESSPNHEIAKVFNNNKNNYKKLYFIYY